MMKTVDVQMLITRALKAGGWDGLCNPDLECACHLDDLAPCGEPTLDCMAGKDAPCDGTCDGGSCDFHIVACEERD